ncbi:transcription factor bHLH162-like isoform X2 [Arachis stenosperma]|uniref:transcription factor bHLH162-like isoform X2 n=1 Tax=Arachis stenosperma TaxID=217475 RepID=UPI0025AC9DFF|nr:transcription factor bHLH162-like isoform X2 [Arachis stenosperma]XP_057748463.1 transcription factor bHLH162-like isoform X2 [Arachis stenosperma]XP_057748464.1 transcription factor bHLH162-like isoform X2 [Arachis stenosperma]XP_057748465.1 transcription factor bHLH162-like isoform X2 [Arachis stenosperma]
MDELGSRSEASPSSTNKEKIERRFIERNRRKHMKMLYSTLNSLLPNYPNPTRPKEALSLLDQVDKALNYIKSLEEKVKMSKRKKNSLLLKMGRKRTRGACSDGNRPKPPQLEVHEMGSCLQIVMTCGLDSQFIFYEIIRILNEENIDVKSANSSLIGNSMHHVVYAEIPQSLFQLGATKVSESLKRFVKEPISKNELQSDHELLDFEIDTAELAELLDFLA